MSTKEQKHSEPKASTKRRLPKPATNDLETAAKQQIPPAAVIEGVGLDPGSLTAGNVLQLQRAVGNQAVGNLLTKTGQGSRIQPKLQVGPAGDQYEQQADQVAAQVMSAPALTPDVQQTHLETQSAPKLGTIQREARFLTGELSGTVQEAGHEERGCIPVSLNLGTGLDYYWVVKTSLEAYRAKSIDRLALYDSKEEAISDAVLEKKMGRFETKGEVAGFTKGLLTSKEADKLKASGDSTITAAIGRWEHSGQFEESDVALANRMFNLPSDADAKAHKEDLVNAYTRLCQSKTHEVGKKLAELLLQDREYSIKLSPLDPMGNPIQGEPVEKKVKLKLIIKEGLPGQFLSPFEQGWTKRDIVKGYKIIGVRKSYVPNPLPATIIWDPKLHFQYIKPRTDLDKAKSEKASDRRGVVETMEPWVVLGHELGHFQDFLEKPDEYAAKVEGDVGAIEGWNLPREQALVSADLGKTPRTFYQDFVGGSNEENLRKPDTR